MRKKKECRFCKHFDRSYDGETVILTCTMGNWETCDDIEGYLDIAVSCSDYEFGSDIGITISVIDLLERS